MGGRCPRWPRVDAGKAKACIRGPVRREKFRLISISKILKTVGLTELPKRMRKTEIYSKIQEMGENRQAAQEQKANEVKGKRRHDHLETK